MSRHPGSVEVDRAISHDEAMELLRREPERGLVNKPAENSSAQVAPVAVGAKPAVSFRDRVRRVLLAGAGVAVLGAGAYFGWGYWTVGRFHVSTDDAYVQA